MNLPSNYRLLGRLDLTTRKKSIQLGVANFLALVVFGWLFLRIGTLIRPDFDAVRLVQQMSEVYDVRVILLVLIFFAILAVMVCLHEALHGLFIRVLTSKAPRFGFRIHPYAALPPDAYTSRNRGILLLPPFPLSYLWVPIVFLSFNCAASVGDVLVTGWLLKYEPNTLWGARDTSNVVYGHRRLEPSSRTTQRRSAHLLSAYTHYSDHG